ncbi:hypothetical protein BEN47_02975 [Hymenobacter lapidarius]|uniref:Uncharacterized protein n=1 Tax=Hymenobacter lapidarius TaxID=1908237 RepID=A0A1G1T0E2_9BACT|nr:hypothetical protein [Hymenobacter lapidarius]OGX84342.1 hypothetical protein BEN47_02975 [Hymenobacter lapidarius]
MIFTQKQLFLGTTHIALRAESLYVCKRNPQGVATLETEVPYEEVLPVKSGEHRHIPTTQLVLTGLLLLFVGYGPWRDWLATGEVGFPLYSWWLILAVNVLAIWLRFEQQWCTFRLQTAHLAVTLAGRPWQRKEFRALVAELERRTKTYLRDEYGQVNPLGFIEPQLRRVAWLRELDVLSAREAQALSIRLTGRRTTDTLKSMGQELESPYLN